MSYIKDTHYENYEDNDYALEELLMEDLFYVIEDEIADDISCNYKTQVEIGRLSE